MTADLPALRRREDWQERLLETISRCRNVAFRWGVHDCASFTARCVQAMTGEDLLVPYRADMNDLRSIAKRLHREGHRNLLGVVQAGLGESIQPAMARRGDIAMFRAGRWWSVGVCVGRDVVTAAKPFGVAAVALEQADHAWRIG